MSATFEAVWRALDDVCDPELGMSVTALGLIYGVEVRAGAVRITMTLTTRGCPLQDTLCQWVRRAVMAVPGVEDVEVMITFEPSWTPDRIRRGPTPPLPCDPVVTERNPS